MKLSSSLFWCAVQRSGALHDEMTTISARKSFPPVVRFLLRGSVALGLLLSSLTAAPDEWRVLFNGSSLERWETYGRSAEAPIAWQIEGDALAWRKGCGHLITREKFGDFELELEWKLSSAGNSGVMFRVDGTPEKPWQSGPEIQLLDDARHGNGKNPLTTSGALYALYPPLRHADRPVGEWNRFRLRAEGDRIQAWSNGEPVADVTIGSVHRNNRVSRSKFAPFPQFARSARGRLLLQDHGNPVWFRDIRVRVLFPGGQARRTTRR